MDIKGNKEANISEKQYPRGYFEAPVYFAFRIHQIQGIPLTEALANYTGLYREVTGKQGLEGSLDPLWTDLTSKISNLNNPNEVTEIVYGLYLKQPHSEYNPNRDLEHVKIFGSLGYFYNPESREVRIHFYPKRSEKSDLSTEFYEDRRTDFKNLLSDIKTNYPEARVVKISSWLQNLPNYRNLFPKKFQSRLKDIRGSSYLGIWGQFIRGNGTSNLERLKEFEDKLQSALTLEEVIDAFPLKVLEAIEPMESFYKEYKI